MVSAAGWPPFFKVATSSPPSWRAYKLVRQLELGRSLREARAALGVVLDQEWLAAAVVHQAPSLNDGPVLIECQATPAPGAARPVRARLPQSPGWANLPGLAAGEAQPIAQLRIGSSVRTSWRSGSWRTGSRSNTRMASG